MFSAILDNRFDTETDSREPMREHDNFIKIGIGFMKRGIPEAIFETRKGSWLAGVDADNFLARIDFLLLKGTRDNWDHAFYFGHHLEDREWIEILEIQTRLRLEDLHGLSGIVSKLEAKNERILEIVWGTSLAIVGYLVVNFFDGKNTPLGEILPPAQVQQLTNEQLAILRQQAELFLQQNQETETPTGL